MENTNTWFPQETKQNNKEWDAVVNRALIIASETMDEDENMPLLIVTDINNASERVYAGNFRKNRSKEDQLTFLSMLSTHFALSDIDSYVAIVSPKVSGSDSMVTVVRVSKGDIGETVTEAVTFQLEAGCAFKPVISNASVDGMLCNLLVSKEAVSQVKENVRLIPSTGLTIQSYITSCRLHLNIPFDDSIKMWGVEETEVQSEPMDDLFGILVTALYSEE